MEMIDLLLSRNEGLERKLEESIVRRTNGRLRQLHVEVSDNRVAVYGTSPNYHVKQLALQAVREMFERAPLDVAIEVMN